MCGWCLAYCTGVVLNTVGESAMPDSKENKQADADSRCFRRHFLCGALLCDFLSTEHEGLSTHVQREWSAESFMPSIPSLRIFCTAVLPRCKFSPPTVCVLCFLPIHSGHQVRWTYQSGSHRRKVTQDFSSTFFLGCWCNVWLVFGLLYWRRSQVPCLTLKKTSRGTQAVVVSEGIFCAARCCVFFYLQSMKVYLHMSNGNSQQNLLCPAFCH